MTGALFNHSLELVQKDREGSFKNEDLVVWTLLCMYEEMKDNLIFLYFPGRFKAFHLSSKNSVFAPSSLLWEDYNLLKKSDITFQWYVMNQYTYCHAARWKCLFYSLLNTAPTQMLWHCHKLRISPQVEGSFSSCASVR